MQEQRFPILNNRVFMLHDVISNNYMIRVIFVTRISVKFGNNYIGIGGYECRIFYNKLPAKL